jgi:outer membrane protein OmpA-like peptidoglycan-associated protein
MRPRPSSVHLASFALAAALIAGSVVVAEQAPANKRRLGPEINTEEYREAGPLVSADGSTLYFIREDQGQELATKMKDQAGAAVVALEAALASLDPATRAEVEASLRQMRATVADAPSSLGLAHQTIWVSTRGADGRWTPAVKMPPPLSDEIGTIWAGSVLPDNNTLLVGGQVTGTLTDTFREIADEAGRRGGDGFFDLLHPRHDTDRHETDMAADRSRVFAWSTRTAAGWSPPSPIRMRGFSHNADRLEVVLAPDGRHLLLALRNAESNGEHDLFVSTLGDDGVWGKPANLGTAVNSPGRECSPFMAPDSQTLYFCSDRAGGLGGFDFYVTRRLDDTWRRWAPAESMGAEINTPADDISLTVDASGRLAFMAIGPLMREDIYEFALPPALRPRPVAFVWGRVTTPEGDPLAAGIAYEVLKTGAGAGQANAKPGDGAYQIALPIGDDYAFRASAAGYVAISDRIDLSTAAAGDRFERNLVLVPLEVGKPIRLNNVFFDTARTTLLPESTRELDRLVELLRQLPALRIEIRGHTDSVDDAAFNLRLSEGRATAVADYLAQAGVDRSRFSSRGFGESMPVSTNSTEKGRAENRRVEFVVVAR